MRCPACRIDSMRPVASGATEVDRCISCGAAWFDPGEVRELTEGRFAGEEAAEGREPLPAPASAAEKRSAMARAHREAAGMECPRCGGPMRAVDFRMTGIPVLHCRGCGGIFAPRNSVSELARRSGFERRNADLYAALGESMATELRRRLVRKYAADRGGDFMGEAKAPGLPVVVPFGDAAPAPARLPVVTWMFVGLTVATYLLSTTGAAGMGELPARLALPSGTGFAGVPRFHLLLAPFLAGGVVPLAVSCLFLLVLGDNVEDRVGRVTFLFFYILCGAVAGAAHVLLGKAGAPAALGSAGAVAGVLGAYLVFFPEVPVSMYGMGETVSVPAYLFACAWAVGVFLWGWGQGPLSALLDPAPYGLAAHLAGFSAGVASAVLWRTFEESGAGKPAAV
ncbi:MAG TPA: rhomboid family intramembrane serine protease [Candidatus Deferrimicrobiaceae bacterium]